MIGLGSDKNIAYRRHEFLKKGKPKRNVKMMKMTNKREWVEKKNIENWRHRVIWVLLNLCWTWPVCVHWNPLNLAKRGPPSKINVKQIHYMYTYLLKSAYPALLTMPQSPFSPVFSLINLEKSLIPLLALHWFCCITNVQCPKSISCTRLQIYVCVDLAVSFQSSSLVTSNWITYHRENIFKILSFQNAKHSYKK